MSQFIAIVEENLDQHLRELESGPYRIREPIRLTKEVQRVRAKYGRVGVGFVAMDRVEEAVASLKQNRVPTPGQLFVLAHALSRRSNNLDGLPILECDIGEMLLAGWERAAQAAELPTLEWQGLFHSYMQVEDVSAAVRLRRILARSMPDITRVSRVIPTWLAAIRRHDGLLGTSPCREYVEEMIDGECERLDDLRASVDVPPGSWFWKELCTQTEEEIASLRDGEFKPRIDQLLRLAEIIPGSRNRILSAALTRYAKCADRSRHVQLLQYSLDTWHSPQIGSNALWGLVGEDTRQMVCGWLAQEDLEDFYQICRGQHQVDQRRLRFWLRFKDQMGYTQILLGGEISRSRDPDIRDFIRKKKGRLGHLSGGPATNNAILMQIGDWVFVEFSETGNACYGYRVSASAIQLGRTEYQLYDLKNRKTAPIWMRHADGYESWEHKFLHELRDYGIHPDGLPMSAGRNHRPEASDTGSPSPTPASPDANHAVNGDLQLGILGQLDVTIEDNRSKGGVLWAFPRNEHARRQLLEMGFEYSGKRRGFYRK